MLKFLGRKKEVGLALVNLKSWAMICAVLCLSACQQVIPSKTDLLNMVTKDSGYSVTDNLSYGSLPRQNLDVYTPNQASKSNPLPVVMFVHGGSWVEGSKDEYKFLGQSLASAGYVTVVINYRLAPEHVFPDYVEDTAKALKWIKLNIQDFGGNPEALYAMGHSAGAFNVVSAVDDPRFFDQAGLSADAVQAVIAVAGPYSYDYRKFKSKNAFPADSDPKNVMPVYHMRQNPVPHLVLTAENDTLVGAKNAVDLEAALKEKGADFEVKQIKGSSHISVIAAMATRLKFVADTREVVLEYLADQEQARKE